MWWNARNGTNLNWMEWKTSWVNLVLLYPVPVAVRLCLCIWIAECINCNVIDWFLCIVLYNFIEVLSSLKSFQFLWFQFICDFFFFFVTLLLCNFFDFFFVLCYFVVVVLGILHQNFAFYFGLECFFEMKNEYLAVSKNHTYFMCSIWVHLRALWHQKYTNHELWYILQYNGRLKRYFMEKMKFMLR